MIRIDKINPNTYKHRSSVEFHLLKSTFHTILTYENPSEHTGEFRCHVAHVLVSAVEPISTSAG